MQNVPVPLVRMEITEAMTKGANLRPVEIQVGKDMVSMIQRALDRNSRRVAIQTRMAPPRKNVRSSDEADASQESMLNVD